MKKIRWSKTIWFNVVTGTLAFLALPEFVALIPSEWLGPIALINAVGNMLLRIFFTASPVTKFAAEVERETSK